jgi:PAS domain S-box-containing protein
MVDINDHFYALTFDNGIVEIFDTIFIQLDLNLGKDEKISFIGKEGDKILFGTDKGRFGYTENQEVTIYEAEGIGAIENLIFTQNQIYARDDRKRLFAFDSTGGNIWTFSETVEGINQSPSGNFWVFGSTEIHLLKNNEIVRTFRNNEHFSSIELNSVSQDNESNLWLLSRNGGLAIICPNNFITLSLPNDLIDKNSSFCYVSQDKSVFTQKQNGGLVRLLPNGQTISFEHPELSTIGGMVEYNNLLYIATYQGLFYIKNNHLWKLELTISRGLNSHLNIGLFNDQIVLSNYNNALLIYDDKGFRFCDDLHFLVNQILIQSSKNAILASSANGLIELFFGPSDTLILNESNNNADVPNVLDICKNEAGDILAATSAGLWWIRNNKVDTLYAKGSSTQNFVNCEYDGLKKQFWVSTSREIFKLKLINDTFEFHQVRGLESFSGELLPGAMLFNQNRLTFPLNSLLIQYIDFDFRFTKYPHPINFTGVYINELPYYSHNLTDIASFDKLAGFPQDFSLTQNAESIRIDFDLTFWNAPDDIKFQYRLIGFSDQWSEPTYQNSVTYNHLPFGDYTFEVKAENEILNFERAQLRFTIERNFYENPIFLIVLLLIASVFIYTLLRVFTSFTFEALEVYTSVGSLIQKIRILSVLTMLVLPIVSYLGSVILRLYAVDWFIIWIIVAITFLASSYTFIPKPKIGILKLISPLNYSVVYSLFVYMGFSNNLETLVALEISCLILFAKLIFEQSKSLALFLGYTILFNMSMIYLFDVNGESLAIYISATVICVIILAGMILAEGSNLNKLSFADRVLESSSLYVVVCDVNGKVIYINNMVSKLFDQDETELLGQRFWRAIGLNQEEIKVKKNIIRATISAGKAYDYDGVLKVKNRSLNFRWSDYVLENKYLIEIGQDITASVELEREVETLIKVATSVNNGVVILDEKGRITWCNYSFEQLTMLSNSEYLGKRLSSLLDFIESKKDGFQINETETNDYIPFIGTKEVALYNKNHDLIWVLITSTLNHDAANNKDQYIEVWTDITASKTLQEEYKFIIENASDILYSCNYKGYFTFVSDSMTTQFRYPKDYLLGRHVSDVIAPEHLKEVSDFYAAQFKAGIEETYFEFKIKLYTGESIWVGQNVKAIFEGKQSKKIKRFQAIARDITINKHYEENLKTLSLVAQKTNNLILIMDKDLKIIWTNNTFLSFFGYTSEFVIGKNPSEFLSGPKTDINEMEASYQKLKALNSVKTQVINYTKAGEEVWIQMNIDPVVEGNEIKYIAVEQDITERVKKEEVILEQASNILQSINYSLRIQNAALPDDKHRKSIIKDSFVINEPKEIVSGDFFLIEEVEIGVNRRKVPAFVVADCTGHGIPGAMLSLLCSSILKQAMTNKDISSPAQALDFARLELQKFFKTQDEFDLQDGMDAGFCLVDYETMQIVFSGANLPLWIARNGEIIEIKGDKQQVGFNEIPKPFTNHNIDIEKGDQLFLFTDGITDQIGSESGKRFMNKNLKNLILSIIDLSSDEQEIAIKTAFNNWMGDQPQTDDVCMMGIKI